MPGVWQKVFKFSRFCGNIRENLAKKKHRPVFFSFRRNIRENLAKGWTTDVSSGIEQQNLSCTKELHSCTDYIAYDQITGYVHSLLLNDYGYFTYQSTAVKW